MVLVFLVVLLVVSYFNKVVSTVMVLEVLMVCMIAWF